MFKEQQIHVSMKTKLLKSMLLVDSLTLECSGKKTHVNKLNDLDLQTLCILLNI